MSSVKFGIITQARLGSTRLQGKVFKKIKDKSLLEYHLDGLRSAKLPIIVATTDLGRDDEIAKFCQRNGIQFFRGSETDVLKRFYKAAQHFNLDYIVRVTSDCPLIRGNYISEAIKQSEIH